MCYIMLMKNQCLIFFCLVLLLMKFGINGINGWIVKLFTLILLMIIPYNIHLNEGLFGALLCSVLGIYEIKSSLTVEPLIWNCLCRILYSLHGIWLNGLSVGFSYSFTLWCICPGVFIM